jgi:hypothetical protein
MKKTYRITDTITLERTWTVLAASAEEAIDKACHEGPPEDGSYQEEQVEATPYEAHLLDAAPEHNHGELDHWSSPNGCHEDCPACAAEQHCPACREEQQ